MLAWKDYKKTAKERGALALELYIVESVPSGPDADIPTHLPAHLAYQKDLESRGILVFAGPVSDVTGQLMSGIGMMVYRADSLDEAKAIASKDPMHTSGTKTFSVRAWLVNEGALSLDITLSDQRIEFK